MRKRIISLGVMALLFAACSVNEMDIATPTAKDAEEFFATIEDASTRVFVDDDLMVLWHADDRVSIFNKYTYNQQYRFTGNTGANSGSFTKVPNDDFVTGNALNSVYAIYPYKESTEISNQGVLTIDLPATQSYAENSFGIGANTMVSCSEGNELLFKNLCGYIMLKLYGDDVTVKSISIKGNNDEPLAGKATINASVNSAPTLTFDASATKEITLSFDTPVTLGTTAETAKTFWLVVPPTTFSKGITLTVKDYKNREFEKVTTSSLQISRNTVKRMSALDVVLEDPDLSDDAIVFADEKVKAKLVVAFDTNGDGELSYKEAAAVTYGYELKNAFGEIKTYSSFREFQYFINITSIPANLFYAWNKLSEIVIPVSVTSIGNYAFKDCINLGELILPNNLQSLGYGVFAGCTSLKRMTIPDSVSGVLGRDINLEHDSPSWFYGDGVFEGCTSLEEVTLSNKTTSLGVWAFRGCTNLKKINNPTSIREFNIGAFYGCNSLSSSITIPSMNILPALLFYRCGSLSSITIPNNIKKIGSSCFYYCSSLTNIEIPESVTFIGSSAFEGCAISSIIIPESVSTIESSTFRSSQLASIIVPESITSIGQSAFYGCSQLTTIIIPDSVMSIGYEAFRYCGSLSSITINATTPPSGGSQAFNNTNNCPIYVPSESVDAYKSSWSNYADRIQAIPSSVPIPEAIDLGLPSGLKWASFNLGASKPEEYGDYYAWGETEPYYSSQDPLTWKEGKEAGYHWPSYKWCMGVDKSLTKYCTSSNYGIYGYEGFSDGKTAMDLEDDAAHVKLGGCWRMPSKSDWYELLNNCTRTWVMRNGVYGFLFTSSITQESIFFPASGYRQSGRLYDVGSYGYYWCPSIDSNYPTCAWRVYFFSDNIVTNTTVSRYKGYSIRPVYAE